MTPDTSSVVISRGIFMRRKAISSLLFSVLTMPSLANESTMITLKANQIGDISCLSRIGNDTSPIDFLLTRSLNTAIAEEDQKDAAWKARNPGSDLKAELLAAFIEP